MKALLLTLAACSTSTSVVEERVSLGTPWTWHPVHQGLVGADGVDLADVDGDGDLDLATPWEQSAVTTVSLNPGCGANTGPWPTTVLTGTSGAETARWGDLDLDGHPDLIVSGSNNFRLYVKFGPDPSLVGVPSAWVHETIGVATNYQRWLNATIADVDGDGVPEIVGGGYGMRPPGSGGGPSTLDVLASTTPRVATSWTRTTIGQVGATFSLEPIDVDGDGDIDLVISDRDTLPTVPPDYSLRGSRWLENAGGGAWVNHPIENVGGMRWLYFDGDRLVAGHLNPSPSITVHGWNGPRTVAWPSDVGDYSAIAPGDIDGDGREDLVITTQLTTGSKEGVVWLRRTATGYERGSISGPAFGYKYDDLRLVDVDCDGDLDVVTSDEGLPPAPSPLGTGWFENPRVP